MGHAENDIGTLAADATTIVKLKDVFTGQHAAFLRDGTPPAKLRIDRIDRAIGLLVDHQKAICGAISEDFGCRTYEESMLLDAFVAIEHLKYCRKHLREWTKPERRSANFPLNLFGAHAEIHYQPKGVVAKGGIRRAWTY